MELWIECWQLLMQPSDVGSWPFTKCLFSVLIETITHRVGFTPATQERGAQASPESLLLSGERALTRNCNITVNFSSDPSY